MFQNIFLYENSPGSGTLVVFIVDIAVISIPNTNLGILLVNTNFQASEQWQAVFSSILYCGVVSTK